jgi:DNA adenine methylase
MDPRIQYRGGKSREIRFFSDYYPDHYDTYYEPFLGGGAVFFSLEPQKAVLNDVNERLMSFYRDVRDRYGQMREQLDSLQSVYDDNQVRYRKLKDEVPDARVPNDNEELYYEMRAYYNKEKVSEYLDGTLYFFINKTAYSGMIRHNSDGGYNVPFGRYPHFNTKKVTKGHSELLKGAGLLCGDYSRIFSMATEKDFMFLDPPYDCTFNDYGNTDMMNGFDEGQHRRLAKDFAGLKCKALMVIGKTPLTEELYGDQIKGEYSKTYTVNIRNRFKANAEHMIVTNYDRVT